MSAGTTYNQKDVVLIPFPYSDLTGAKQRPALIVSNSKLRGNDKICMLITSQKTKEGIKIENNAFASGTLPFESHLKPHRIFTIHENIIRKKLCTINDAFLKKAAHELLKYLE